jgi:hypothetical protein
MATMIDPRPGGPFRLGHPEQSPRLPFAATIPNEKITEKHRPATLSEVVGQGEVLYQLGSFLDAPHPNAFCFEGPTGVGKTSVARALAAEFGLHKHHVDYFEIDSGKQDGGAVENIIDLFRFPPMMGGYRFVVVDEADGMTPKAAQLWLSCLESIPDRTVLVFLTNHPEKLPPRFLDRLERLSFRSDGRTLKQDAQALVDSIWEKETGSAMDAPEVDDLPNAIDRDGVISFRRCVEALGPILRDRARSKPMPPGRPTVAFAPAPERPTRPVAPSPQPARSVAAPAPRKRPTVRQAAPVANRAKPRPEPRDLTRLRVAMNQLLAEEATLGDLCHDACAVADGIRAEWKRLPKSARPELRKRLKVADAEVCRLGELVGDLEQRMDAARDAIERAERRK